jgi:hypothetical protein
MDIYSHAGTPDVRSILIQSDGSIIAAGNDSNPNVPSLQGFIVAKYQSNGTLNSSFGNGGCMVATSAGNGIATGNSVAMQAGGDLIMGGGTQQGFLLARFINNGSLVQEPSAIADNSGNFGLQVYPNPTHGPVTVQYNLPADENVTIQLWDLSGQILGTVLENAVRPAGSQTQQMDISQLPAGYYMLNILNTEGNSTTVKLVKE